MGRENEANEVNECIALDIMETSKITSTRNYGVNYILVIGDVISKFVTTYPLQKMTDGEVIHCLMNYFGIFRSVKCIWSDNQSIFRSKKIKKFCAKLNVTLLNSSPLKSRSRGFIEGIISKLRTIMRILGTENDTLPDECILYFSDATRFINTRPMDNNYLNPMLTHFVNCSKESSIDWLPEKDKVYNQEKIIDLQNQIEIALTEIKNKALEKLSKKNKNRVKIPLSVGDLVLIKRFTQNKNRSRFHEIPEKVTKSSQFIVHTENILNGVKNIRHRSDVKRFTTLGHRTLPEDLQLLRLHYTDNYLQDLEDKHNDPPPTKMKTRQSKKEDETVDLQESDDDEDVKNVDFLL